MEKKLFSPRACVRRFLTEPVEGGLFLFRPHPQQESEALLFSSPLQKIICDRPQDVTAFFRAIETKSSQGYFLAGYFSYELGYAFERRLTAQTRDYHPLACLGVFGPPVRLDAKATQACLHSLRQDPQPDYWLSEIKPQLPRQAYQERFTRIQELIAAGDTYQANLTFPLALKFIGHPGALFLEGLRQQPVGYAAYVSLGRRTLLSWSPELFFQRTGDILTLRPMKGTAFRSSEPIQDAKREKRLIGSAKNRAENIMIVDLLRNDLGRLCRPGTVMVSRLCELEKYRTVFQMTSSLSGRLRASLSWHRIFKSVFPSGSVTGTPKIRTMEILREMEKEPRGVYTGAMGFIRPGGDAILNVGIRTLALEHGTCRGHYSVGSGIVADSRVGSEWRECLLKAKVLQGLARDYQLIETLLYEPGKEIRHLSRHWERLQRSAEFFRIPRRCGQWQAALQRALHPLARGQRYRIRLLVSGRGGISIETAVLADERLGMPPLVVGFSRVKMNSKNLFLQHKTTNREVYQREGQAAQERGWVDALFQNERGHVTEGSFTNVFVQRNGVWLTPPNSDGVLPGVMRAWLLHEGNPRVIERSLRKSDLLSADRLFLANAVRGLFEVRLTPD